MRLLFVLLIVTCVYQNKAQQHVFYLHGRIIEIQGADAVETTNGYGAYKYNTIIDSLKANNFIVHSEVRSGNTDIISYAQKIQLQINELLQKGVKAKDICVIGASKGASIALKVAELVNNAQVKYVVLAACCSDDAKNLSGQFLSIYEASDNCGTCSNHIIPATTDSRLSEIELNTGLRHGFFYIPRNEWLVPTVKWAKTTNY